MENKSIQPVATSIRLLDLRSMQNQLGISRPTANRLLELGLVKSVRLGRAIRIPEASIAEFIQKGGERHLQQGKES